ncbi:MAG: HAD-IA family hydrolase [Vicinamibacterales bacterium]
MFSLVVFDLDGTLVDSRRDLSESANELLAECGADALSEAVVTPMVGNGAPALVARAFAASGIEPPADAVPRFVAIYARRLLNHTRAYPRMDEVLAALGARASLAVLTNKPLAATRAILAGLNLARHFADEAILGGDGPLPRKPDPTGLQYLLARVGTTPPEALLVGDSMVDWRTARNASTAICLARYGFGFAGVSTAELGPDDRVIDAPADLLQI